MRTILALVALCFVGACVPPPPAATTQNKKQGNSSDNNGNNPMPNSSGPCGTVTTQGICSVSSGHKVVKRCESNKIVTDDCTNQNKICSLDSSSRAVCSDVGTPSGGTSSGGTSSGGTSSGSKNSPTPGPKAGSTSSTACTGNVPATGICTGNTMKWCENGKVNTRNCSSKQTCTYGEEGATVCLDNSSTTPTATCPGVPDSGVCSGNQVKWCASGTEQTRTCSSACQYGDDGTPYCPISGCGNVPDTGICEGTTMKWCENGTVRTDACSGGTCAYSYDGPTYCDTSSGGGGGGTTGSCGDVPATGICEGNIRKWCEGGTLHTDPCDPFNSYCDISPEGAVFCNYGP